MNWALFQNSVLVAGAAMLLSVTFGLAAALWLAGLEARWRTFWLTITIVALAFPPFLVTNCWIYYLGEAGVWHHWLPLSIYTPPGTVWILALLTWPITVLSVLGAWQRLEAPQLESDTAVTGLALMRGLLFPVARGALIQAAVLTFVLTLNNFSVPAILQTKVFPAEVWVRFNTTFDSLGALQMSWPMMLTPLLLLACFRRKDVAWPRMQGPVSAKLFRRQLGAGWSLGCGVCTVIIASLAVGLPLFQLASTRRTWTELPEAIAAGKLALWNSIFLAVVAATLCVAMGFIAPRAGRFVGTALWLPFLTPGVLVGIGLIALFNRPIFSALYHGVGIVILAYCIRYLAFGWNGVAHALRSVDRDLTDAARIDGASRWQMLRHAYWPQVSAQLAAVWYLVFLLCLWDVESIVLVVPPGGETLALRVFNLLHYGHNPQVNAICLALLAVAAGPLILWWLGKCIVQLRLRMTDAGRTGVVILTAISLAVLTSCSPGNPNEQTLDSKIFSRVEVIGTRGTGAGELNKPRSVAVDHQDNLYVVDMTGRVQKFSPDGQFLLSWRMHVEDPGKVKGEPKGMGTDNDGNIIVVEPHYQRVNLFTTDGKRLEQWGERGTNAGQFIMPRAVAVNSHGDYFIPEYTEVDRVQQFTGKDKKLVRVIGHTGTGDGEFDRPEGLCVDAQDRLYVADSCNHRIQVFSPDGQWLRSYGHAGSGPGEFSYPYDIRVDKAGRQYVCEFGGSRLQVFDANDRLLEVIGGPGVAPGQFSNPWSMAFDSEGDLYVADSQNHRVQKFIRRKDVVAR
ncbi:MAG TPA: 6-bladed beta-propeller [Verrucomicrobiae bacterium]|jgi:ABC-type Fe3+ transport system permease subunit/DNA-binding beta-propeller fold protein YncE|nr:6-bladed beta-propeller [Verrucomicrobiae bacterium]